MFVLVAMIGANCLFVKLDLAVPPPHFDGKICILYLKSFLSNMSQNLKNVFERCATQNYKLWQQGIIKFV